MLEKKIDQSAVKMSGDTVLTKEPVPAGTDVIFQGNGAVISESFKDNHNGTFNHVGTIKIHYLEVKDDQIGIAPITLTETGAVVNKSKSKVYRDKLWHLYQKRHPGGEEFEKFYDRWMDHLIEKVEQALAEE